MKGPTVTVLMPVYNGEAYVEAAIDSVLGQSFADFELLVINDGSHDSSPTILQRYADADARVRVVTNPQNIGLAATLNKGRDLATGELIARMDADDICTVDRLAVQVAYLRDHP
ncbi:glycosyltransferase family A protein, partial [cf. Phormidesmis sp. LEGE 11477]|uniref:glycosyltransferase family 2 protein n=1 Tax=cf. Phormidesmis sp. LEGE 11477 TaxID=1828680 RepID=UPI001881ADDC